MGKRMRKQVPLGIERVRSQFEQWRAQKRGRERIPERLWCAAVDAARRHGVHAVSCAARLNHGALSERVDASESSVDDAAAFVELSAEPVSSGAGCIIELEKSNGARMRICVREGAEVDWARMKEAFLGA